MRILIIGGTKFIGPYVVKELHEKGHEVILFNRGDTIYSFPFPVQYIHGDRTNLLSCKDKLLGCAPDVVIDMISYSENDARQLADTFRGIVQRIVIISSCDVYRAYDRLWKVFTDELMSMPLDETADLRENFYPYRKMMASDITDWRYYYEKILVENTIRSYPDINSTILRLPFVYGPGDYSRIYPYLKTMDDNKPILIDEAKANWRVSRGYVEDVAHAIVLSALDTRSGNKLYNVGENEVFSELEWVRQIGEIAGWNDKIIKLSYENLPTHLKEPSLEWKQDLIINTHRIRDELHYNELHTHKESMRMSIDWLRISQLKTNNLLDHDADDNTQRRLFNR